MAKGKKTGGRTKGTKNKRTEVLDALGNYANEVGIPALKAMVEDKSTSPTLKFEIHRYLIDRQLGKPKQAIDNTHDVSENLANLLERSWDQSAGS